MISLRADDRSVRRRFSADEIREFLPPGGATGPFVFPDPYSSRAVRLTHEADGRIEPSGYAYWNNANAHHLDNGEVLVAIGRGAEPGLLLAVHKVTHRVTRRELPIRGTGENWRFSLSRPFALYVTEGPILYRLDVRDFTREIVFDLRTHGRTRHYLWQSHSSADDAVHSATLRLEGTYEVLGAVVYDERTGRLLEVPQRGDYDECQVDKSGRYLVVKEGADVRVVDLETDASTWLEDLAGAPGHSDCGFGAIVGEDDRASHPGAFRLWTMEPGGRLSGGTLVYHMAGWDPMARHVSWCHARPWDPTTQRALISSAHRDDLPRANELVLTTLDGSLDCTVVAPTLVDLDAPGGATDYHKLPKANVDPSGEYAIWTANCGTARLDAFLVLLNVGRESPPPATIPSPPAPPATSGGWDWIREAMTSYRRRLKEH